MVTFCGVNYTCPRDIDLGDDRNSLINRGALHRFTPVDRAGRPSPCRPHRPARLSGQTCNEWLVRHTAASVRAGVSAVYQLLEANNDETWVVGYFAIHVDLRADQVAQWGRQLLRDAIETIVRVAQRCERRRGRSSQ